MNGTGFGGSLMSTRALATALLDRDIEVQLLQLRPDRDLTLAVHKRLENLRAKLDGGRAEGVAERTVRLPGRRPHRLPSDGRLVTWESPVPANALSRVLDDFRPTVVVTASISRPQWRQIRRELGKRGIQSVLYVREDTALGHLTISKAPPDLLLANSEALATMAEEAGYRVVMIPSVVDVTPALVESTRETVLVVNPSRAYGGELAGEIAERCPDIPFVLQESWHAGASLAEEIDDAHRSQANVEVRPFTTTASDVYRDARLLLVPYPTAMANHRPRSVLEAQANGIPVLASDLPGLRETVGDGGWFAPPDADPDEWAHLLRHAWADVAGFERTSTAARRHAQRPEASPVAVVDAFVHAIEEPLPTGCAEAADPADQADDRRTHS